MRILTVRQPWAWLIVHGGKDIENRTRNIAGGYRGPVAIHAALRDDNSVLDYEHPMAGLTQAPCPNGRNLNHNTPHCNWCQNIEPLKYRGHGHIIGVVDLVGAHDDCHEKCLQRRAKEYRAGGERRKAVTALPNSGAGGLIGRSRMCSPWALADHYHLELANPQPLREPIPYKGALGLRNLPPEAIHQIRQQIGGKSND